MAAIPKRHMELCQKVAELCRDAGMEEAAFSFLPPMGARVNMTWTGGNEFLARSVVEATGEVPLSRSPHPPIHIELDWD